VFKNIRFAFRNCSDEIKAQVPVSWGGTNKLIDGELKLKEMKVDKNYYSAFEVMPNKVAITKGTIDNVTNLEYNSDVAICTTHRFTLGSNVPVETCDVVIDWGDGTVEAIKDGKYEFNAENGAYDVSHNYSANMTSDVQRFIVKIYGKDYYTFRHNSYQNLNLISRIFDKDLPIAPHVGNFANMAIYAKRLLSVHFPHSTAPYSNVWNWSSCFGYCPNLKSVTGFSSIDLRSDAQYEWMMRNCPNLETTDFKFPDGSTKIVGTFYQDTKLSVDIAALFPENGFTSTKVHIEQTFRDATSLTGTVPVEKLWGDDTVKWSIADSINEKPFTGCSNEIRTQVPVSWGGTLAE
jgi:hypothetical protein